MFKVPLNLGSMQDAVLDWRVKVFRGNIGCSGRLGRGERIKEEGRTSMNDRRVFAWEEWEGACGCGSHCNPGQDLSCLKGEVSSSYVEHGFPALGLGQDVQFSISPFLLLKLWSSTLVSGGKLSLLTRCMQILEKTSPITSLLWDIITLFFLISPFKIFYLFI